MRKITVLIVAASALFLSGCAGSRLVQRAPYEGQKSSAGNPVVANLEATNGGIFLFYGVPLWSGSVVRPNYNRYATFENYIKPQYAHIQLSNQLKKTGGDAIEDVKLQMNSTGWPGLGIFWKRSYRATAVAVKLKDPASAGKDAKAIPLLQEK